jgi:hypothetical protein
LTSHGLIPFFFSVWQTPLPLTLTRSAIPSRTSLSAIIRAVRRERLFGGSEQAMAITRASVPSVIFRRRFSCVFLPRAASSPSKTDRSAVEAAPLRPSAHMYNQRLKALYPVSAGSARALRGGLFRLSVMGFLRSQLSSSLSSKT